ncbi:UdgX family uracil-DNA binding protein [Pigmentiphaga aceris]|uniref:Type-4 uracil-DNA glycosylase n=1 Tax=Pigmentiphaga aceris TaxID=1940612 RepID=A0A5C0AXL4_9BURK|nr:UdgX family uracil-DNA binding protein [Pigmentiphaga aceris]QEI05580.1 UdgX family uracil-DNA binding protein [Pigmentiphaga aceris]
MSTRHRYEIADFEAWRRIARELLLAGVPPHDVDWLDVSDSGSHTLSLFESAGGDVSAARAPAMKPNSSADLFSAADVSGADHQQMPSSDVAEHAAPVLRVSRQCLDVLRSAAMFRDAGRWALLYQALWRWQQGDQAAISPADSDGARIHVMVKAVQHEIHRMHAYVRFRETQGERPAGSPQFIAWFEPVHEILRAGAPYFRQRMGRASWMIATPGGIAQCHGEDIEYGPPIPQPPPIDDAGESLWLSYYQHTFNPSRVNARVMTQHMPVRYWKNLPEGKLIPGLVAQANAGSQQLGQTDSVGARKGAPIRVSAARAMPVREAPRTLDTCTRCELGRHATQGVAGIGPRNASIMLVGEQPGDQEDLQGTVFVGPAGQLLNQALEAATLSRDAIYLTNAVKHFKWEPRGKRRLHKTPAQQEVDACRYWLEQELTEVAPKVIVTLGATALRSVLNHARIKLQDQRGRPLRHGDTWVIPTWHPAYVLRVPDPRARTDALADIVAALRQAQALSESDVVAG